MSTVHSECDVTALVLATAQAVLDHVTAFPSAGALPIQLNDEIEVEWSSTIMDCPLGVCEDDIVRLRTRLGDELRERALQVEKELATVGYSICFLMVPATGVYGFACTLHLNEHGDVEGIVGAFISNTSGPIVFNPESPMVLEVLASDLQRSLADRVRILGQFVRIYSDAVRLLRLAVGELREHYAKEAGRHTGDTEDD